MIYFKTFIVATFLTLCLGDRTKDKIYENINGRMCFRRLNSTHQTGCSSPGKSVGVLHVIFEESDLNFILNNPPVPPYATILTPKMFTREIILKLRDSEFVSAIVLINDTSNLQTFSQESKCPNSFFRHSRQPVCDYSKGETTWNPFGSGLLHENFDIPIMFVDSKNDSEKLVECFNNFNKNLKSQDGRSVCSIEINSLMSAAGNSEICVRRSKNAGFLRPIHYCDPLQGKNVYATLFPREIVNPTNRSNDKNEKIILISARLDTTSMFDGVGLGATELVSVATLISASHYLRKITQDRVVEKTNVMFVLFNGESYDFIGSQRFLYDLKNNAFPSPSSYTRPLTLDNVQMIIDIGPLDTFDALSLLHVEESNAAASSFIKSLEYYKKLLNINLAVNEVSTNNIPPVSAQTFLSENMTIPALILATSKPENKFYHSVYDDGNNINYRYQNTSIDFDKLDKLNEAVNFSDSSIQIKIRNLATLLALSVYDVINSEEKYSSNELASSALVDEFLYCYLVQSKCRLFDSIISASDLYRGTKVAPQRYVSVQASITLEATAWAYRVFGFTLSNKIDKTEENCTTAPYYWLPGSTKTGECRLTTQNLSLALSPAFEDENYNFKSNKYSTWTESTWNDLSARIFLRPSQMHESFTFTIGLATMIVSFVIVYVINSKASILFNDIVNPEHVSLPAQC